MRAAAGVVAIRGLLGGDTPPTSPYSVSPVKPEVTMISASLDNPALPLEPGLEIVGISVRR